MKGFYWGHEQPCVAKLLHMHRQTMFCKQKFKTLHFLAKLCKTGVFFECTTYWLILLRHPLPKVFQCSYLGAVPYADCRVTGFEIVDK